MDIHEAREVVARIGDNFGEGVKRRDLVAALRTFELYNTDALNTLVDRDERIDDLEKELAEARQLAADRQAVIDSHGGAMRELRTNLLRDAEDIDGVTVERDRLKSQVTTQTVNALATTQRHNERLKWLAQQAGITFPATWDTIKGHVGQAFADQKRWKEAQAKIAELSKKRDGDRVTKIDLNVLGAGYTFRMDGTINRPFRSFLMGDQEQR